MGVLRYHGYPAGSRQRPARQVPAGPLQQHVRPGLEQLLPAGLDDSDPVRPLVAHPQAHHPLPMEVAHHLHSRLSDPGRLRLLRISGPKCLHGLNRLHDPPLQRNRKLPLRCPPLPREKPAQQSHRPPPGPARPLLPAHRLSAIIQEQVQSAGFEV